MDDIQSDRAEPNFTDKLMKLSKRAETTFWGKLGCELLSVTTNSAIISLEAEGEHLNLLGIVHGGVYMSLMDNAMGLVVMSDAQNERVVTATMNTHFLASCNGGKLQCKATLLHRTKRSITLQAEVEDEKGQLLAWSSGLYRIIS